MPVGPVNVALVRNIVDVKVEDGVIPGDLDNVTPGTSLSVQVAKVDQVVTLTETLAIANSIGKVSLAELLTVRPILLDGHVFFIDGVLHRLRIFAAGLAIPVGDGVVVIV